jgi:outer membrane protein assembly factor BamB
VDLLHVTEGYPFFHKLQVFGDRFTAVAPDLKTLRGFTFEGRETWRRSLTANALVERRNDEHLYVQEDRTVLNVRASDGTAERLFEVPEHHQFAWHPESGTMYFVDERFDKYAFQLLDPNSRRPLWTSANVNSVLYGDETRLVVASTKRNYAGDRRSYTETDVAIAGLDRRTGEVRWRVDLGSSPAFFKIANVAACIVILHVGATGGLSCIDRATGQVLGTRPHASPHGFGYADIIAVGDDVAFVERDGDAYALRFAAVPSFEISKSLRISTVEPELTLHRDFVLMKGIERAVCLDRQTGKQLWERARVGAWIVRGDQILVSDYNKSTQLARLVIVDPASGNERILMSEAAREAAR